MTSAALEPKVMPWRSWWALIFMVVIMAAIMLLGPYETFEIQPRRFTFDYPWKLPDPTWFSRAVVWFCYGLHQIGIWFLIYKAQTSDLRYVKGLHSVNVQALLLNAGFVVLHIAQTRWTYDGLAQDVPEFTALASVALMLFVIMLMENNRRGLFFGKPVPLPDGLVANLRRYHGYYFAWAITYTFWYHPMATTPGHLLGFFYMLMLFLQGSLFFTRMHVNRWWTVTLEFFFVIHGTTVAWFSVAGMGGPHWSQFLFSGIGIFAITQLPGVPLTRWQKYLAGGLIAASIIGFYAFNLDIVWEFPRVLIQRYGIILVLGGVLSLFYWLIRSLNRSSSETESEPS